MRTFFFVVAFSALLGCPKPVPQPIDPNFPPDATDAAALPSCAGMCAKVHALGCKEDKPNCAATCTNIQTSGLFTLDLACRMRAPSCAAMSACEQ